MAYLTGQIGQGNLNIASQRDDGVFECSPCLPQRIISQGKTNTWHMFFMKAVGRKGEKLKVKINWPSYDPSLISEELKNAKNFEMEWESFIRCACDVVFMSSDKINWTRVENAAMSEDGTAILFNAELPSDECYFSVTLYYTVENYRDLLHFVEGNAFIKTEIIGHDCGGDEIYAFTATDFSVPESEKKTVYIQGTQHCSEFNGAHLCDFMLRWFAGADDGARSLLRKYVFRLVPVVSVTSWRLGLDVHHSLKNPNRDWVDKELLSTKAVADYLEGLTVKPSLLLDIHSGIANYGSWETCQALSVTPDFCEEKKNAMRRFVDTVYENCDFLPTCRYWESFCDTSMFDIYGDKFGQAHTMEVSHYAIYDREAGHHFPIDQKRLCRFARQLAYAIDIFFEKEKELKQGENA